MKRMDSQKGQALILIALAIDGSRAFSDKRHACYLGRDEKAWQRRQLCPAFSNYWFES